MLTGLLDRATQADPGLSRPAVTLTFGAAAGGGGGIGGALGEFASAVGLGGAAGPGLEAGLVSLRLRRGIAPAVDVAELLLAPVPGGPDLPAPGDAGEIGFAAGDATAAFACTIDRREDRADGLARLTATNGGRLLARLRVETAFESQSPGAIIDALAAEAGVTSQAGSGTGDRLPRYVADEGCALLDHVARLAATAGRLAAFDDAGALVLIDDAAEGGEAVARLVAGETLLDWRIGAREAPAGAVTIDGAMPQAVPGAMVEVAGTGAHDGLWRVLSLDLTFDLARGMLAEIRAAPAGAGGGGIGGLSLPGGLL